MNHYTLENLNVNRVNVSSISKKILYFRELIGCTNVSVILK